MPINADIQNDPNQCGFSLPTDACVGDDGPSPTEVTNISGSTGAKTSYTAKSVPVGYDGPGNS